MPTYSDINIRKGLDVGILGVQQCVNLERNLLWCHYCVKFKKWL